MGNKYFKTFPKSQLKNRHESKREKQRCINAETIQWSSLHIQKCKLVFRDQTRETFPKMRNRNYYGLKNSLKTLTQRKTAWVVK